MQGHLACAHLLHGKIQCQVVINLCGEAGDGVVVERMWGEGKGRDFKECGGRGREGGSKSVGGGEGEGVERVWGERKGRGAENMFCGHTSIAALTSLQGHTR